MDVLLIENNIFFQRLIKKSGKKEGINIDTALSSDCVNPNKKYDLIIFDYLASEDGQQEHSFLHKMYPEAEFIHYCIEKPDDTDTPFVNKFQFKTIKDLLIVRKAQCSISGMSNIALS